MTGKEAKALIVSAFGTHGPTTRAARYLQISRRKLHDTYNQPRVPKLLELALRELKRDLAERSYAEIIAETDT